MGYYHSYYWRNPEPAEPFTRGVLSSRVVSRLSGATTRQLGYWHSTGLLTAAAAGRRGIGRLYSWIEYSRARATVKLLGMGLSHAHIRPNIDWLEAHLPRWYEIPVVARDEGAIALSPDRGLACNAGEMGRWISANLVERPTVRASTVEADALARMIEAIDSEGPLGVLAEYSDAVDMDPHVLGGVPVMRGTRIETGLLASLWDRELDIEGIALRFGLDARRVERALEFQIAIAA